VFETVKTLLREHRAAPISGLPPFTSGAVGFFSYDVVRQLEEIGDRTRDDLHLPDCVLMFFDRLLAFDHVRHQIHILAAADVRAESPRKAYDRAVADIAKIERKLAAGPRGVPWVPKRRGEAAKLKVHAPSRRRSTWTP